MGRKTQLEQYQISFDQLPAKYWSVPTKMSFLQRRIIVWSILYYEMAYSCVDDIKYDAVCFQLVDMIHHNPEAYKKSKYYYAMQDFDGSTGFNIVSSLNQHDADYLREIASGVIKARALKGK